MGNEQPIDCYKCQYFYVTWDSNYPRGCRAFQFKTNKLPSIDVKKASGENCLKFSHKKNM